MEEAGKIKEEFPVHHKNKKNFTEKIRENPWILSTFVLTMIVLLLVLNNFFGFTGNAISQNKAGQDVVNFLNKYITSGGISLDSVKEDTNLGVYVVNVLYGNSTVPVTMSKDGKYIDFGAGVMNIASYVKYLNSGAASSSGSQTQKQVTKTDKPNVELYVFAYCPYGLQMEKAVIPVVKLLGSSIDFKIRQIGAMHGDFEKVEAERQLCIEKNYPDKYLDYVLAFGQSSDIGSCQGDAACLAPKLSALYTQFGFDANKINSCMTSEGETLYNAEVSNANSKGVTGSPTMIINGVEVSLGRSQGDVLKGICSAFTTAPSACSQTLSTTQTSAGFGASTSSSTTSSSSCG